MSFYAVAVGRLPGIYSTWKECEKQIIKFPGALYKKFKTKKEAEEYVEKSAALDREPDVRIYTDGSCIEEIAGWAYLVVHKGNIIRKSCGRSGETNNHGELKAIQKGLMWLLKNDDVVNLKVVEIVTDSFYSLQMIVYSTDIPELNTELIMSCRKIMKILSKSMKISFRHVNSHKSDDSDDTKFNNKVDRYATRGRNLEEGTEVSASRTY